MKTPGWSFDSVDITFNEIEETCIELKSRCNLGLIVIDYIQLLKKHENDKNNLTNLLSNLKLLSQKIQCPVIILSQLSRSLESRTNKRPNIDDFTDSSLGNIPDIVLMIYRDDIYKNLNEEKDNKAEIIIYKNDCGKLGNVELSWDKDNLTFKKC